MEHVWWSITGTCQKCGAELLKCLVMFSSDGELRFLLECDKCKIILNWRVFASALAEKARDNDIERCHKAPTVIPVSRRLTPPLAKSLEGLSADDIKLLKEFHILPDDPRNVDDIIREVDKGFPPLGKEEK
jgi:hypothetical protein